MTQAVEDLKYWKKSGNKAVQKKNPAIINLHSGKSIWRNW